MHKRPFALHAFSMSQRGRLVMDVVFGTGGQADDALRQLASQEDSRKARRGGFHPKPRQGEIYCRNPTGMAALPRKDDWEHDTSKSVWNKFFHNQDLIEDSDDDQSVIGTLI